MGGAGAELSGSVSSGDGDGGGGSSGSSGSVSGGDGGDQDISEGAGTGSTTECTGSSTTECTVRWCSNIECTAGERSGPATAEDQLQAPFGSDAWLQSTGGRWGVPTVPTVQWRVIAC